MEPGSIGCGFGKQTRGLRRPMMQSLRESGTGLKTLASQLLRVAWRNQGLGGGRCSRAAPKNFYPFVGVPEGLVPWIFRSVHQAKWQVLLGQNIRGEPIRCNRDGMLRSA
mmetsp:Transcript_4206/g.9833  ORF Transcript_4206/g.9833 Transcript_4206/m.9833 type:complete len:110 (-) Transcript_4206:118-447(-)